MNKKLVSLAVVSLVASLIAFGNGAAQAAHLMCGDTIVADTKLDESLSCIGDGIIIGADGITLDLNGFTIAGDPIADTAGVSSFGFADVVIKNGAISGFQDGIRADPVTGLTLEDLAFSGQILSSIVIINSAKVRIKRVIISQAPGGGGGPAEAIRLASVDNAIVTNVTVDGGVFGLLVIESTNLNVLRNTFSNVGTGIRFINSADVSIRKNRIVGTDFDFGCFSGIDLVEAPSTHVRISGNVVTGCDFGMFVATSAPTANIVIEKNNVNANNSNGIFVIDTTDSKVIGNRVHLNGGCGFCVGISLIGASTGNIIGRNKVTGHGGVDLFHQAGSSPNIWFNNTCDTSAGADIDCP